MKQREKNLDCFKKAFETQKKHGNIYRLGINFSFWFHHSRLSVFYIRLHDFLWFFLIHLSQSHHLACRFYGLTQLFLGSLFLNLSCFKIELRDVSRFAFYFIVSFAWPWSKSLVCLGFFFCFFKWSSFKFHLSTLNLFGIRLWIFFIWYLFAYLGLMACIRDMLGQVDLDCFF